MEEGLDSKDPVCQKRSLEGWSGLELALNHSDSVITDTFLEKSFAQRAGLREQDPCACSTSLESAPSPWSSSLQQRPGLFLVFSS